jgi:hypothetical protein
LDYNHRDGNLDRRNDFAGARGGAAASRGNLEVRMKGRDSLMISMFWKEFGAPFAPSRSERQVGKTGELPSSFGRREYPPQAVENRKITRVSLWLRNALFSAGKRTGEKRKQFGSYFARGLDRAQRTEIG